MTTTGAAASSDTAEMLGRAVHRHSLMSWNGLLERGFTLAFRDLVYPMIWEDPRVDIAALDIRPSTRMITIASGGCNVLDYLAEGPSEIVAVDLNRAHIALNRLKLVALRQLDNLGSFTEAEQYCRQQLENRFHWNERQANADKFYALLDKRFNG